MPELPTELTDLSIIRANARYTAYRALYRGVAVFVKQASNSGLTDGIRREVWGLDAFGQLAAGDDLGFAVPKLIMSGDSYAVTSWVDGQPMDLDPSSTEFDDQITFFANSLAKIDMLTCSAVTSPSKYSVDPLDPQSSISKLRRRLDETDYRQHFDPLLIERGFAYLHSKSVHLTARLTHADLTPGNVLEHAGQRTLIDYESVSLSWPRFYDLVNLTYNRMIVHPELVSGCRKLIERYFLIDSKADLTTAMPQMNTIAMIRALSLIYEHSSEPNDYHNTQQTMTGGLSDRLSLSIEQVLGGTPFFDTHS